MRRTIASTTFASAVCFRTENWAWISLMAQLYLCWITPSARQAPLTDA
jgi:hypothetical protein